MSPKRAVPTGDGRILPDPAADDRHKKRPLDDHVHRFRDLRGLDKRAASEPTTVTCLCGETAKVADLVGEED